MFLQIINSLVSNKAYHLTVGILATHSSLHNITIFHLLSGFLSCTCVDFDTLSTNNELNYFLHLIGQVFAQYDNPKGKSNKNSIS
jgi:hypothetical protein